MRTLLFLLLVTVAGAATLRPTDDGHWILDNGVLRVEVDATRGARVNSCRWVEADHDFVRAPTHGLFMDHESLQGWPGELLERAYETEALATDGAEVALACSTVLTGEWKQAKYERTAGVALRKTFRLRDGEAALHVTYELRNPTDSIRQFGLWVQNVLHVGSEPRQDVAIRPYETGIVRFAMGEQPHGWAWRNWANTTAAWTGVRAAASQVGVFFLPDYHWLDAHYNAGKANSVEWFMTRTPLPPGRSWATAITMICREVPRDLVAIDTNTWLGAKLSKDQLSVVFTNGGDTARFTGTLLNPLHNREWPLHLELPPGQTMWPLPDDARPPHVLSGTFAGLTVEEFLGGGTFIVNEAYPGGPPAWIAELPPKEPDFLKPDTIALATDADSRALLVYGPMTLGMRCRELLEADGITVAEAFERQTGLLSDIVAFPSAYETMLGYGTVILNNVDTGKLTAFQRELLHDYLNAGGRILGFGGTQLTAESWTASPLAEWTELPPATLRPGTRGDATPWPQLAPDTANWVAWPQDQYLQTARVGDGTVMLCGLAAMGRVQPADYWGSEHWASFFTMLRQIEDTP